MVFLSENMNKWEYKVVTLRLKRKFFSGQFDAQALQEELNKFGQEGWELVNAEGIIYRVGAPILMFKRLTQK